MEMKLHKKARTTLAIRKEIAQSKESIYALAKKYNLNWATVKRWKAAICFEDKSSRPHRIRTTLTPQHEDLICFERKQFKKTIEEIFLTLQDKIPNLYPMKSYRCLRGHGLDVLPAEFISEERKIKRFRQYGIGYLHIDVLYSPKINKEMSYIYTAIDRVSKLAYIMIGKRKNRETGAHFLRKVLNFYSYKINYILTDNGLEFSYKALPKGKKTEKVHPFDKICRENGIQHRTIRFKHPWINRMAESFHKRIRNKVLTRYLFSNIFEMNSKLIEFVNDYNLNTRLKSLNYKTPAQYLEETKNITIQRIVIQQTGNNDTLTKTQN